MTILLYSRHLQEKTNDTWTQCRANTEYCANDFDMTKCYVHITKKDSKKVKKTSKKVLTKE